MSKQIVEGYVEVLMAKELPEPDRFDNKYRINVKMDNGTWYGFGTAKRDALNIKDGAGWHSIQKGDKIEFVAEANGKYWNAQRKTLTLKEKGSGPANNGARAASRDSSSGGAAPVGGRAEPQADARQDAIMRQNALAHGTAIAVAVLGSSEDPQTVAVAAVELADKYFLPYAKYGTLPGEAERNEEKAQDVASRQDDDDEFDDDIPF